MVGLIAERRMSDSKRRYTITFGRKGIQPPLYIAGSFSSPEWQPQEMEHTRGDDHEVIFTKDIFVEAGSQIQYKFRVGTGDWWILDDSAPTGR
jgi:hypothetical protein